VDEILKRVERFHSDFLEEIEAAYGACAAIVNIGRWHARLGQLTEALAAGTGSYRQVEDHIFELKVADYLRRTFPDAALRYEPQGQDAQGKNCDLEATRDGRRYLVEIKCFHPEWKPAPIPHEHVTENNLVVMDGESYHQYQAVRGHLVNVARHAEEKYENYDGSFTSVLAVPDGFHLNLEDLRDFVFIYRHGAHRLDDPLGKMTMHFLKQAFKGSINQFWAMPFPQESFAIHEGKAATVVAPLRGNDSALSL
jgi:hypothetical protein